MSVTTESRIKDIVQWWEYHSKSTDDKGKMNMKLPEDMNKRTEMMAKAIDGLLLLLIEQASDIQVLEGRGPVGRNMKKILTPDNVLGRNEG